MGVSQNQNCTRIHGLSDVAEENVERAEQNAQAEGEGNDEHQRGQRRPCRRTRKVLRHGQEQQEECGDHGEVGDRGKRGDDRQHDLGQRPPW